jgi:ribosomal protein L22
MSYTFIPKKSFAKASAHNAKISTKNAEIVCAAIAKKPLNRAMRLLNDLAVERRSLGGKYYTKATKEIKLLLESCEKNAEFMNLEKGRLFVHASASKGSSFHRRRRKSAFGSRMKTTNLEILLIERGKESKKHAHTKKEHVKKEVAKEHEKETTEHAAKEHKHVTHHEKEDEKK